MEVTIKFSNNYYAVLKRIQRLPKFFEKTADTITRKDAEGFVETYKEGIRNNSFHLAPLTTGTIKQKARQGLSKPTTPLYGEGDGKKSSYINALRIRRIKKGYRVYISKAKHHSGKISLNVLFAIHENGAVIKKNDSVIRIPPRPTRAKAFKRFLAKRLREENNQKVKKAIQNYLKTGTYKDIK